MLNLLDIKPLPLATAGLEPVKGEIKSVPEDFIVDEELSFTPTGAGEHLLLQVEKIGQNTQYVAQQLARLTGLRARDISYAGLKDRHAVTRHGVRPRFEGDARRRADRRTAAGGTAAESTCPCCCDRDA